VNRLDRNLVGPIYYSINRKYANGSGKTSKIVFDILSEELEKCQMSFDDIEGEVLSTSYGSKFVSTYNEENFNRLRELIHKTGKASLQERYKSKLLVTFEQQLQGVEPELRDKMLDLMSKFFVESLFIELDYQKYQEMLNQLEENPNVESKEVENLGSLIAQYCFCAASFSSLDDHFKGGERFINYVAGSSTRIREILPILESQYNIMIQSFNMVEEYNNYISGAIDYENLQETMYRLEQLIQENNVLKDRKSPELAKESVQIGYDWSLEQVNSQYYGDKTDNPTTYEMPSELMGDSKFKEILDLRNKTRRVKHRIASSLSEIPMFGAAVGIGYAKMLPFKIRIIPQTVLDKWEQRIEENPKYYPKWLMKLLLGIYHKKALKDIERNPEENGISAGYVWSDLINPRLVEEVITPYIREENSIKTM